jgi:hypothetical protein
MLNRRNVVIRGSCLLAAPYFFFPKKVYAVDQLTSGLIKEARLVTNRLSMRPAGAQDGTDRQVMGGGTLFGRTLREQADHMAGDHFTEIETSDQVTREVHSNGIGYMFARFRSNRHNICCPLGIMSVQNGGPYAGAMTLIEGPNLVALQGITGILEKQGFSSTQMHDLCWPTRVSDLQKRERALVTIGGVTRLTTGEWADRDVLYARSAVCSLLYEHNNGVPTGFGDAALIRNGQEELRVRFTYDLAVLRSE